MYAAFRIVITGYADDVFIASLIEDVKKLTPVDGGFTFEYGTHTDQPNGSGDE